MFCSFLPISLTTCLPKILGDYDLNMVRVSRVSTILLKHTDKLKKKQLSFKVKYHFDASHKMFFRNIFQRTLKLMDFFF